MRLRIVFALALVLAQLSGCAATSAQVLRAKNAEYQAGEYAAIFETCKQAMVNNGYDIQFESIERGVLVSTYRWYSKDGASKAKESPRIEDGAAVFRIGVELAKGPRGGWTVHVDGGAQGYTSGSPVAQLYKHGDADEPPWVAGKIDNLSVEIYEKLKALELPAAPK